MAKPLIHARNSVKRYGGSVDDYLEIHNFMDSTKAALPEAANAPPLLRASSEHRPLVSSKVPLASGPGAHV